MVNLRHNVIMLRSIENQQIVFSLYNFTGRLAKLSGHEFQTMVEAYNAKNDGDSRYTYMLMRWTPCGKPESVHMQFGGPDARIRLQAGNSFVNAPWGSFRLQDRVINTEKLLPHYGAVLPKDLTKWLVAQEQIDIWRGIPFKDWSTQEQQFFLKYFQFGAGVGDVEEMTRSKLADAEEKIAAKYWNVEFMRHYDPENGYKTFQEMRRTLQDFISEMEPKLITEEYPSYRELAMLLVNNQEAVWSHAESLKHYAINLLDALHPEMSRREIMGKTHAEIMAISKERVYEISMDMIHSEVYNFDTQTEKVSLA